MINESKNYVINASESRIITIDDSCMFERIVIDVNESAHCTVRFAIKQSKNIELTINLVGPYAHVSIIGYYLIAQDSNVAISTTQNHLAPHSTSKVVLKGILFDTARASYNGMIHIAPGAAKSNAVQENKNLLLSKTAQAYSVPSIEVLTDDVQCAHGSAIGYLDKKHLWYLHSRGIETEHAQKVLLEAFLSDVVEQ